MQAWLEQSVAALLSALALLQARRERAPVVFAVLDVDHFKRYNDRYGHQAGDVALALIARAIDSKLRPPMDMVGRLGGEAGFREFSNARAVVEDGYEPDKRSMMHYPPFPPEAGAFVDMMLTPSG